MVAYTKPKTQECHHCYEEVSWQIKRSKSIIFIFVVKQVCRQGH